MYDLKDIVNTIICGHSLDVLRQFPAESVNMCITSPPYWGKRSYKTNPQIWDGDPLCEHDWSSIPIRKLTGGTEGDVSFHQNDRLHITVESEYCTRCSAWRGELGHEPTPELFVSHLMQIFDEVKRVLRRDGSLWVNIGESYGGSGVNDGTANPGISKAVKREGLKRRPSTNIMPKSQCCIPEMFKLEMVMKRGWTARNTLIWAKPNAMPESSSDRFTVDFEHLFFFVKNNSTLFWTNEKTMKLTTRQPKTDIEDLDWEWRSCRRCGGTGTPPEQEEESDDQQQTLESFFNDEPADVKEAAPTCRKCVGTGRVRANLWTGHDYYFEQQFEPYKMNRWGGRYRNNENVKFNPHDERAGGAGTLNRKGIDCYPNPFGRNMRSVWTIKTMSFQGAHFAVYPQELITTPIKAGCPEYVCKNCGQPRVKILKPTGNYMGTDYWSTKGGSKTGVHIGVSPTSSLLTKQVQEKAVVGWSDCGCSSEHEPGIVLDPFSGSGTTALVALKLGRRFIGIDTNPDYVEMANGRIKPLLEQKQLGGR